MTVRCVQDSAAPPATGSAGNAAGWAWNKGTGWISFSGANPIAKADAATKYAKTGLSKLASRIEGAINRASTAIGRFARFFRLNYDYRLAKSGGRHIASFIDSLRLSLKIAIARAAFDYGVTIDSNGDFAGFAWSDNLGWIYFGPDRNFAAEGFAEFGNAVSSSAPFTPKTWAHYDEALSPPDDNVTGWAKILSLGDDGWIKMSDSSVTNWDNKGVHIVASGTDLVFDGWAWNSAADGGAGIGWISFNYKTCDLDGNGTVDASEAGTTGCPAGPVSPYWVSLAGAVAAGVNNAPVVSNLTAPNWSYAEAGQYGARRANLRWLFSDPDKTCDGGTADGQVCASSANCTGGGTCVADFQTAYQIIINTTDSLTDPLFDSGQVTSNANQYSTSTLDWATAYYWWVRVWDHNGASSTLVQYDSATDTNGKTNSNPRAFSTFNHEFPDVSFKWSPVSPSKGENITFFCETCNIYTDASPDTAIKASSSPKNADWLWLFVSGEPESSGSTTPVAKFASNGSTVVSLKLTDLDGYYTQATQTISANLKLPIWQEKKPK